MEPQYFGSVRYYAQALRSGCGIDTATRYDKRHKSVHRCEIADVNGRMQLTVPIVKEHGSTWGEVKISEHGHWRQVHLSALEAAYGRTPYFEFYIDRFRPVFEAGRFETILGLDLFIDQEVRKIVDIGLEASWSGEVRDVEYYQVREDKLGFIAGLSILDLIFNMGPESPLVLKRMIEK